MLESFSGAWNRSEESIAQAIRYGRAPSLTHASSTPYGAVCSPGASLRQFCRPANDAKPASSRVPTQFGSVFRYHKVTRDRGRCTTGLSANTARKGGPAQSVRFSPAKEAQRGPIAGKKRVCGPRSGSQDAFFAVVCFVPDVRPPSIRKPFHRFSMRIAVTPGFLSVLFAECLGRRSHFWRNVALVSSEVRSLAEVRRWIAGGIVTFLRTEVSRRSPWVW